MQKQGLLPALVARGSNPEKNLSLRARGTLRAPLGYYGNTSANIREAFAAGQGRLRLSISRIDRTATQMDGNPGESATYRADCAAS